MIEDKVDMRIGHMTVSEGIKTDKLWIGDPCYALDDAIYDHVIYSEEFKDCVVTDKFGNVIGLAKGTMYGDGQFSGYNRNYPVDAGLLSILDWHSCKGTNLEHGTVFNVAPGFHSIKVEYDNGEIMFYCDGERLESITTGDDWEDEEYVDDYDDDDYFD